MNHKSTRGVAAKGKLFQPRSGRGYRAAGYYTRVRVDDRRRTFRLGLDRVRAAELDLELRTRVNAGASYADLQAWLEGALRVPAATVFASIGDIAHAHEKTVFAATAKVVRSYRRNFLGLIETVTRFRRKLPRITRAGRRPVTADTFAEILDLPLTDLNDTFITDYEAARLKGLRPDSEQYTRTCASISTEVQKARSMFSPAARAAYAAHGLRLPDLTLFLTTKTFATVARQRLPAPDDRIIAAHTALALLDHGAGDESMFLAVAFALRLGLVTSEIALAHSDWLAEPGWLHVVPGKPHARKLPLPSWFETRLRTHGPGYLLDGSHPQRIVSCARAARFLREHGCAGADRPLWQCRHFYAGFLFSRKPALIVKYSLGHRTVEATLRHLSELSYTPALAALWDQPLRAVPVPPPPKPALGPTGIVLPRLPSALVARLHGLPPAA